MKMMKGMTVALAGLMATGAMAETNTATTTTANTATAATAAAPTTAKKTKKIVQKKPISRKGVVTRKQAKQDSLTTPQSSAISAATATTSMPGLTAGTSAAEAPKALQKKSWKDNVRLSVTGEYYGGSVADPLSGWQPNRDDGFSQSDDSQELDTHITVGYAVSNNLTITYNPYFVSTSDSPDGSSKGDNFAFHPEMSYLKLGVGKIYQSGKFKWNGDLRFYPGLGQHGDRLPLYIRTGQNLTYAITPRLTLADYNTIRYYYRTDSAYNADHNASGNVIDSRVTVGPALEYQMFDTVGVSLSYNMDFAHTHTNNTIAETEHYRGQTYGAYFEAGGSIDFTKAINLNPYVDMYTHTMNVEAFQLGANLNFTIL